MALNNVPLAGQTLLATRNPINQNFATINTGFAVNHIEYNLADQGKHKFLQMPEQIAAPAVAANEAGLYAAIGALSGVTELSFRRENNGAVIPFTENSQAANGWTMLPSGMMLQWGIQVVPGSPTTVNFPRAFAAAAYSVQVTETAAGGGTHNWTKVLGAPGAASFVVYLNDGNGNAASGNIYWFAIGRGV